MVDLSIIILTYNGKELLRQTLNSVQECLPQDISVETIVTDNGSTDGLIEVVKEEYPWVKLVENGENLGFSAGNNRGVKVAQGKYILFLNSDTKILGDAIGLVYRKIAQDSEVGIGTCRVELSNGHIDPASHRGFPTPWRAFCYYAMLEKYLGGKLFGGYHLLDRDLNKEHEIDACTGAFLMISRDLGDKIGWWDEEYFFYGEDLDFCMRTHISGKKVMFYPQEKIIHYKHQSGLKKQGQDIEKVKMIRRKSVTAFYDAMKIFYRKHYIDVYPSYLTKLVLWGVEIKKMLALRKI
jgi:GT2 family glycosyltransferase